VTTWLIAAHVCGFVLWVSGLLATTVVLSRHAQETAPDAASALARVERFFLRALADPGSLITILAGIALILTATVSYMREGWLHMKLTLVAGLIVMHVLIALKAKAMATGRAAAQGGQARLMMIGVLVIFLLILIVMFPIRARTLF
jgi:putative membrane protein